MLQPKTIAAAIISLSTLGISAVASAAAPGFYVGLQGGYGDTHYANADSNSGGIAGRASAGYQFDQNFAVEAGYTQFSNTSFPGGGKIQQYAADLVGKGILPITRSFSAFGKVGAAYVNAKASGSGAPGVTKDIFLPTFGAGVSYDVTPNIPVSIGWDRIQKVGNSTNFIRSSDFFYAGVAYNFG